MSVKLSETSLKVLAQLSFSLSLLTLEPNRTSGQLGRLVALSQESNDKAIITECFIRLLERLTYNMWGPMGVICKFQP